MPRIILHLDLDAFFCAAEEIEHPELKGKAFAVGGKPEERGVVASCSYAARLVGVHSAMPMAQAYRLCPGLIVLSPRHHHYGELSNKVMEKLRQVTAQVEQISIDEAFMDITDIQEVPESLARRLQGEIRDQFGLPCSIGIASNKLVAKIATEVGKKAGKKGSPPFGLISVPAGEEEAFLASLPADMLWGVGPKTSRRLAEFGIHTIGDIARWPEGELVRLFGENGRDLARHAKGRDDRPIVIEHETKSISQETTFSRDVRDDRLLQKTLREMSAQVGRRLRQNNLVGTTVKLKLRWPDFTTLTRQVTLPQSTDEDEKISKMALDLLKSVRSPGKPVRLIGVGVSNLGPPVKQLELWGAASEKSRQLQKVVDALREKYGEDVIHHA